MVKHKKISFPLLPSIILALVIFLLAAGTYPVSADDSTCINCHSDQERLKGYTLAWSKLYVDPKKFVLEAHGGLECITCHNGDPTKDTPEEACVGIAYKDPAAPEVLKQTCGSCHTEIAERHLNSIHSTLNGIRHSLHDLEGEEQGEARFQESCNKCHTTCSDCHMEQPGAHGILSPRVESHSFAPKSASEVCVACHDGTGTTYTGNPDIEGGIPSSMWDAGIECNECHTEEDVHGTGIRTTFMSESPKPECQTCHTDPTYFVEVDRGLLIAPQYDAVSTPHTDHANAVSCVACHTQWYPNCWNCHLGREERSNNNVYMAINPLTGLVHTAVRSPATSPDWGTTPAEIGGGWAIKSRHSWGKAQPCETCHTEADVYMTGIDREAPFLGVWGEDRLNATFVDEKLVDTILIDLDLLADSVHKDTLCVDCHSTSDNITCDECHQDSEPSGLTILPDPNSWSRTEFMRARDSLRQVEVLTGQLEAAGAKTSDWNDRWSGLKQKYLQVSNGFHGKPGEAQEAVVEIADQASGLEQELSSTLVRVESQKERRKAAIQLGIALVGAMALGIVYVKPNHRKK